MTEIPEHLLKRSKAAKGTKSGSDDAPVAAAGAATAPVAAAAPAVPPAVAAAGSAIPKDKAPAAAPPEADFVTASRKRNRIPMWALPLVAGLPIWAISFAGTMQLPEVEDALFVDAAAAYTETCAGCHAADGSGGTGYALNGGSVIETFPSPVDQMVHVVRGSSEIDGQAYGAERADGQRIAGDLGVMPAHASLTQLELELIVFHERAVLSDEDTTIEGYEEWMESLRERIEAGDATAVDLDALRACSDPALTPDAGGTAPEVCPGPVAEEG